MASVVGNRPGSALEISVLSLQPNCQCEILSWYNFVCRIKSKFWYRHYFANCIESKGIKSKVLWYLGFTKLSTQCSISLSIQLLQCYKFFVITATADKVFMYLISCCVWPSISNKRQAFEKSSSNVSCLPSSTICTTDRIELYRAITPAINKLLHCFNYSL